VTFTTGVEAKQSMANVVTAMMTRIERNMSPQLNLAWDAAFDLNGCWTFEYSKQNPAQALTALLS